MEHCRHCGVALGTRATTGWCRKHRNRSPEAKAQQRSPEARARKRIAQRKWNAGFTEALQLHVAALQGGRCAICRAPDISCADHTEVGGGKTPRGLLCNWCNLALGFYEGHQRVAGLRIEVYENYLDAPPCSVISY